MKPIQFTEINGRKFLGFNAITVPQFYPPRKVVVVLNQFADLNGGTWDGGWKPVKRKKQTA